MDICIMICTLFYTSKWQIKWFMCFTILPCNMQIKIKADLPGILHNFHDRFLKESFVLLASWVTTTMPCSMNPNKSNLKLT